MKTLKYGLIDKIFRGLFVERYKIFRTFVVLKSNTMATTLKQKNIWRDKLIAAGIYHIHPIDKNHVHTMVDGETEVFSRNDKMTGGSYASFGGVSGDWRMIRAIAEDIQYAFSLF